MPHYLSRKKYAILKAQYILMNSIEYLNIFIINYIELFIFSRILVIENNDN